MKITNYIILTDLIEQYGNHRFLEGMFKEARKPKEQYEEKVKAGELWERAFNIIKEMEGAND